MSETVGIKVSLPQQGMTRGQRLWSIVRERRDTAPASMCRAKLLTNSYKETEGLPTPIRRAKALEKIVTEIPIYIDEGQLLVGDWGTSPMSAEWHPEFSVNWVAQEYQSGMLLHMFSKEDAEAVIEVYEYWKDKAVRESFERYIGEEVIKQRLEMCDRGNWVYGFFQELEGDKSWYAPGWDKAISKGLSGILAEVEEELQATPALDDASRNKVFFLQSLSIVLQAGIKYGKRYATLARKLAKKTKGERKAELEKIAEICDWVPEKPARTFHEALQSMWFCDCMLYWDTGSSARAAPGRVDQYLFPYYKRDKEEGRLTDEEAIELLECFRVKASSGRLFVSKPASHGAAGDSHFINCTLGGQTPDGRDAVNRLSYLWLEAAMRVRSPHPTLSIRYHDNISPDFAIRAAELTRIGLGFPAWFGDKTSIEYVLGMTGGTLEEARDYCLAGCILTVIPGKTPPTWPIIISMAKVLEITLNNGVDPMSNNLYGLKLGKLERFCHL